MARRDLTNAEIDAAPQRGDDPRPIENLVVVVVADPD